MSRNKWYALMSIACLAGYSWLAFTCYPLTAQSWSPGCLFRHFTGIPCPSCGSTRSILALLHGDMMHALMWNPLGILLAFILAGLPFWLLYDLVSRKSTLWNVYTQAEHYLKRKWIAIPAIWVVLVNWIWNIQKGL